LTAVGRTSEAIALLGDQPLTTAGLEQLEVRRLIDRAFIRRTRTKEANELLSRARASVADPELQIRIHLTQGNVDERIPDLSAADRDYQAALEAAVRAGRKEWQALALNNLCYCRKAQGRYEESVQYGLRALNEAESAGALRTAAFAESNLGSTFAYLGDFPAALSYLRKSNDRFRAMNAKNNLMIGLGELGLAYDRSGDSRNAVQAYQEAYDLALELKSGRDAARHAENMALVHTKLQQWDLAAQWNQRAIDGEPAADDWPYLTRNRAKIELGRGDSAAAARTAAELLAMKDAPSHIRWEAWSLLGEIDTDAKRYAQANLNFARGLALVEATRSDLANAQNRITLLSRLIPFYQSYVDSAAAQNDDTRALRVAESSRARVLAERLGRDFKSQRAVDVATLGSFARASNVWVLSFWVAPKRSFAWLAGPGGVRRFELPPDRELAALVTAHREVIEHSILDPLTEAAPRALWDKVLAPVAAAIPKGSRVIVIPDGPLHRVNLETLPSPAPSPHYWIEDVELAVAPSISIAMSKTTPPVHDRSLLAIGAPDYKGVGYEPLPGAAGEIEQARSRFARASTISGAQATPAAYRSAGPENYSVIHFAAHAEANVERPLESAVVLARAGESYKLHAKDVIDIPIRAELVTLSACRSAGAQTYAGEGLMGFAWAFLHAGAKAVVAGLWEVSDTSTGPLMAKFYEAVAAGRGASCSLREAKLALSKEKRFSKAFYWGAFQTYLAGAN
jgi:CHAT domain-containing protein